MLQDALINLAIGQLSAFFAFLPVGFVDVTTGWVFGMFGYGLWKVTLGMK